MIISTTPDIAGKTISAHHGVVSGETIYGVNVVRDFFAGVRDFVGGRSKSYEDSVADARKTALRELEMNARQMGANAVVGLDFEYHTIGARGSMLMVSVSGTAVTLS